MEALTGESGSLRFASTQRLRTKAGCLNPMHLVSLNVSHIVKEIKIVSWMKYFRALGGCVRAAGLKRRSLSPVKL